MCRAQRGVDRQNVFFTQGDREVYLRLVRDDLADSEVRVLAYCLMTNHVHWVVVPDREDSLAVLFRRVHGRYAHLNARRGRVGHLWQNRFYGCALEGSHLGTALPYVGWNPVRAGLAGAPGEYGWSSAEAHGAGPEADGRGLLDWEFWRGRGGAEGWREMLGGVQELSRVSELRQCTYAGRPFGSAEFVRGMEERFGRQWRRRGRPPGEVAGKQIMGTERSGAVSRS